MDLTRELAMRMFGRPQGVLGRLGGRLMAGMNADFGGWVAGLLAIGTRERVLEVGFGSGAVIEKLASLAPDGHVAGVDASVEMVAQARKRNAKAVRSGLVELHCGSVASLPFADGTFDKALAINSMQVWPDAVPGLRETGRVMKPGGRIALGFTRHSGQPRDGVTEPLVQAGFAQISVVDNGQDFCALATKP
jgi:ubiquinone/menaquinone biosynthesis C-methylase UbiE